MECVRIVLKNSNKYPAHIRDNDGFVSIETPVSFDLKAFKRIEELTDVNKITADGVLGFTVKDTPKNLGIFKQFVDVNNLNYQLTAIPVYVIIGSTYLAQSDLYVTGYTKREFSLELRYGKEHWLTTAKYLLLSNVTYSNNLVFNADLINTYNAKEAYIDGEIGIRFPLVNYGTFVNQIQEVVTEDFRIFYSVLFLLQKAFCSFGWTFRSPFLESDYGRRLITYITAKQVQNNYTIPLVQKNFNVKMGTNLGLYPALSSTKLPFDTITFNPLNLFDVTNYYFVGVGMFDVTVNVKFVFLQTRSGLFNADPEEADIIVRLMYSSPIIGDIELFRNVTHISRANGYNIQTNYTILASFIVNDVQIDSGCHIYVTIAEEQAVVHTVVVLSGSLFSAVCTKSVLQSGDTFKLNDLIDPQYTLLDLLKGVIHLCNGKLVTNFNTHEVFMYPPYAVNVFGADIEGYFIENVLIDLTDRIQRDSEVIKTISNTLRNRYKTWGFKGNGDNAIKALNLVDNVYLFAHQTDFGIEQIALYDRAENPLFEATLNKVFEIVTTSIYNIVDMPYMLDNTSSNASYDIKPRILVWLGSKMQYNDSAGTLYSPNIKILGTTTALIPYAAQLSNCKYIDTYGTKPQYSLIYGDSVDKADLYNYFYKRYVFEKEFNLTLELLIYLTKTEFTRFDLRYKYLFYSLGRTITGRISDIIDFSNCSSTSTPVSIVNEKQLLTACYDLNANGTIIDLYCAQNKPNLNVSHTGNTYFFGIGGTFVSTLNKVTFEVLLYGSTTWVRQAQVIDPHNTFRVRLTITYTDGCATSIIEQDVVVMYVCNNSVTITHTYVPATRLVTASINITGSSPIQTQTLQYSLDDQATYSDYVSPFNVPVDVVSGVFLVATVTYSDGCPASMVEVLQNIFR